jgi:hypothetical protein
MGTCATHAPIRNDVQHAPAPHMPHLAAETRTAPAASPVAKPQPTLVPPPRVPPSYANAPSWTRVSPKTPCHSSPPESDGRGQQAPVPCPHHLHLHHLPLSLPDPGPEFKPKQTNPPSHLSPSRPVQGPCPVTPAARPTTPIVLQTPIAPWIAAGIPTGGRKLSRTCGPLNQLATTQPNADLPPPRPVDPMSKIPSLHPKQLRIWQQNVHKLQTAQDYVRNTANPKDWDIIALQEPWIDSVGNSRGTQYWRVIYPTNFYTEGRSRIRSILLVNTNISTDSYSIIPIQHSDITAICFRGEHGCLSVFNIYNEITNNDTLHLLDNP